MKSAQAALAALSQQRTRFVDANGHDLTAGRRFGNRWICGVIFCSADDTPFIFGMMRGPRLVAFEVDDDET